MLMDVCEPAPSSLTVHTFRSSFPATSRNALPPFFLRPRALRVEDEYDICSWVQSRRALQRISGDEGDCLTPDMLAAWVRKAEEAIVMAAGPANRAVGFCTLSRLEAPRLPASHLEICHLIVAPSSRNLLVGSRLCAAAKVAASDSEYRFVCGRVIPDNAYILALARLHHFHEVTGVQRWTLPGFRWFVFDLAQRHLFRDASRTRESRRESLWPHQTTVCR